MNDADKLQIAELLDSLFALIPSTKPIPKSVTLEYKEVVRKLTGKKRLHLKPRNDISRSSKQQGVRNEEADSKEQ